MGFRLGMNCKAYYGAAGSTANMVMDNIKDVTLNLSTGESDVTTRGNQGWRAMAATLKEGSVEFKMVWDTDDLGFQAIKNAWFNAAAVALMFLDGTDGSGLDADFTITNFTRNEPLEEAVTVDVTAKPTYSTRAPAWIDAT